jgi:hypothetical protein
MTPIARDNTVRYYRWLAIVRPPEERQICLDIARYFESGVSTDYLIRWYHEQRQSR